MENHYHCAQDIISCTGCKSGYPSHICRQCKCDLCEDCSKKHCGRFKSHKVVLRGRTQNEVPEEEQDVPPKQPISNNKLFSPLSTFKVGFSVRNIFPINSSKAWISRRNDDVISLYDKDGSREQTMHFEFKVSGFAFTSTNKIVLALFEENQIIIGYGSDGTINVRGIGPRSVCCSSENEILASFWNSENGEGKVVRYSSKGKKLQEIILDSDGKHIYKCPSKIVLNGDADICAIDSICKHVVVVDKSGKLKFTYRRMNSKRRKYEFYPGDICTDSRQYIFVTDTFNDCLDILDHNGNLTKTLLLGKVLSDPNGLSMDHQKCIWIGNWNEGKVVIIKCLFD